MRNEEPHDAQCFAADGDVYLRSPECSQSSCQPLQSYLLYLLVWSSGVPGTPASPVIYALFPAETQVSSLLLTTTCWCLGLLCWYGGTLHSMILRPFHLWFSLMVVVCMGRSPYSLTHAPVSLVGKFHGCLQHLMLWKCVLHARDVSVRVYLVCV